MANQFKRKGASLDSSPSDIYTAPSDGQSVIHSVFVSNTGVDNSELVYISVWDGTTDMVVAHGIPVPTNSTLILDKPINLESDDILRMYSLGGTLDVYLSIMEVR